MVANFVQLAGLLLAVSQQPAFSQGGFVLERRLPHQPDPARACTHCAVRTCATRTVGGME